MSAAVEENWSTLRKLTRGQREFTNPLPRKRVRSCQLKPKTISLQGDEPNPIINRMGFLILNPKRLSFLIISNNISWALRGKFWINEWVFANRCTANVLLCETPMCLQEDIAYLVFPGADTIPDILMKCLTLFLVEVPRKYSTWAASSAGTLQPHSWTQDCWCGSFLCAPLLLAVPYLRSMI